MKRKMFGILFSLLVSLLPTAAAAWFIQPDVPDRPTVASVPLSCKTLPGFSVYDDLSSKRDNRDNTAFIHTYNPFFVPVDMIEPDVPLSVLSKQPLSSMEFLDRLLLANLRLRLLIQEYKALQKRADKLLSSIDIPFFDNPGAGFPIANNKKNIDDRKNLNQQKNIDQQKKLLETKLSDVLHHGFAVSSKASGSTVFAWQDAKIVSSMARGEDLFRKNGVDPLLAAPKSTPKSSINQNHFNGSGVNNLSLTQTGEPRMPWMFRFSQKLISYIATHKIEVLFYGFVVLLVCCFISLQERA